MRYATILFVFLYYFFTSYDYVALGDSYTAGVTPNQTFDKSYSDYFVKKLDSKVDRLRYYRYAISGYKTGQLLHDVNSKEALQTKISRAELITIFIGTNDIVSFFHPHKSNKYGTEPLTILRRDYDALFKKIRELNPKATLMVVGVFHFYPHLSDQTEIQTIILKTNTILKEACKSYNGIFVPIADKIAENHDKFLPRQGNVHLSQEGYQAIADELFQSLPYIPN